MDDSKITSGEMIGLFGEAMPVEAFKLLAEAPDGWTLAQVRNRLREIAAEKKDAPPFTLQGPDDNNHVWLHIGDTSINLGNWEDAAEIMSQWLGEVDYMEREK